MSWFFDTNILIYAFSKDDRAEVARALLEMGGAISVQCLNEFTSVAVTKLKMSWTEVETGLVEVRRLCGTVLPLDLAMHESGLSIARRYGLGVFDSMIVAAALEADCEILWSEDMHDGLVIERRLTIRNPFA